MSMGIMFIVYHHMLIEELWELWELAKRRDATLKRIKTKFEEGGKLQAARFCKKFFKR
jgi:hypothetical protein